MDLTLSEKLEKLRRITDEQQDLGTDALYEMGIFYDDGTIQGVNEHIPRTVARIDDSITSHEYVWSSAKTNEEIQNITEGVQEEIESEAEARDAAITLAISNEVTARNAAISSAISGEAAARNTAISTAVNAEAAERTAAISGLEITSSISSATITVKDSADARVQALAVYGKTESGSSVGDNGLVIKTVGKNLAQTPENYPVVTSGTAADWIITKNDDGSFYISGESTAETYLTIAPLEHLLDLREGKQYVLSGGTSDNSWATKFIFLSSNSSDYNVRVLGADEVEFTAPDVSQYPRFYMGLHIAKNYALDNVLIQPMIRPAGASSDFEAHKEKAMTITTGLPLRGVKVSSGGIYTDDSGQQWISDELDLHDLYVVKRIDTDGTVLSEPIITALSESEGAAFADFRTFESVTSLYITDNAFADTIYVKNTDNGRAFAAGQDSTAPTSTYSATGYKPVNGAAVAAAINALNVPATYSMAIYVPYLLHQTHGLIEFSTVLLPHTRVIYNEITILSTDWSGTAAPYTYTYETGTISPMDRERFERSDHATADVVVSDTVTTGLKEIEEFGYISKITIGNDSVTFKCYDKKPDIDLTIGLLRNKETPGY